MTERAPARPASIPASALSADDLALLHADLPIDGPQVVEFEDLDAEALNLCEWGVELPMFPSRLLPDLQ